MGSVELLRDGADESERRAVLELLRAVSRIPKRSSDGRTFIDLATLDSLLVPLPENLTVRVLREPKGCRDGFRRPAADDREGVFYLSGKSGMRATLAGVRDIADLLHNVGYPEKQISHYLDAYDFSLFVGIPGSACGENLENAGLVLATWDNIASALRAAPNPQTKELGQKISGILESLRKFPYEIVFEISGEVTNEVSNLIDEWNAIPVHVREKIISVRRELEEKINLNALFSGDGRIQRPDGTTGPEEYFSLNGFFGTPELGRTQGLARLAG